MPQGLHVPPRRHGGFAGLLRVRALVCIMLLGLCAGWAWVLRTHGAYQGTVHVTFAAPGSDEAADPFTRALNPLSSEARYSLIKLAGVTVRSVAGLHTPPQPVDASVTLLDSGVYDGYSVVQPSDGGQWSYSFSDAGMQIQATGPSAEAVTARIDSLVAKVRESVTTREDAKHVGAGQRVKILVSSSPPPVYFRSGSKPRAIGGMTLLSALTLVAMTQFLRRHEPAV